MLLDTANEPFLIAVLDVSVDMQKLATATRQVVSEYRERYGDEVDLTKPYTIVLTESEQDSSRAGLVDYSAVQNTKHFDRPGQAILMARYQNTEFARLAQALPFPYSIIRLSVLPARTIIGMHTDAACHAQLAMYTNPDCFVAARSGETCHVPVDSKLYIISTTLPHTAFNASEEERAHISISIFDEDYTALLQKNAKERRT